MALFEENSRKKILSPVELLGTFSILAAGFLLLFRNQSG
jgi:hypothetical protein